MTIVDIYIELIKAGRKTVEEVPEVIRGDVIAFLEKEAERK